MPKKREKTGKKLVRVFLGKKVLVRLCIVFLKIFMSSQLHQNICYCDFFLPKNENTLQKKLFAVFFRVIVECIVA